MKTTHLFIIACSLAIASCSSKQKDPKFEYTNDLENVIGWTDKYNNVHTIVNGIARSGQFISKTDTVNRFGYIFRINLADVSEKQLKEIKASVWANETVLNDKAVLVIAVNSANKTMVWEGKKLSEVVKEPNKWTEIIATADISKLKPSKDYIVTMYVWNTGSSVIYTDDHRIKFN